ncbi:MAG: helix-turn-helix domain-containing protein [Corallococcus sp.]|nr:helix-turn-helix domain-containing protein [Corallococcus sp.]
MEDLKNVIAKNLAAYRKQAGLTQQELAEKLSYSDKAVSKWERAEGVPDIFVLKTLADMYGITVNDILTEHAESRPRVRGKNRLAKRWLITLLSAGLVYLIATVITVVWLIVDSSFPVAKYAYLIAFPVSMIVLVVFSCVWGKLWMTALSVSALIWSLCLLIHVCVMPVSPTAWLIYLIGAALQLLVIMWFLLQFFLKRNKKTS